MNAVPRSNSDVPPAEGNLLEEYRIKESIPDYQAPLDSRLLYGSEDATVRGHSTSATPSPPNRARPTNLLAQRPDRRAGLDAQARAFPYNTSRRLHAFSASGSL
jgi:hypothetical protein